MMELVHKTKTAATEQQQQAQLQHTTTATTMTLPQQVMDLQAVVTQLEQEAQRRTSPQNNTSVQQTALQKSVHHDT
jgi:hypothetical protein